MTLTYEVDLALYSAAHRLLRRKSFLRRYGLLISILVAVALFFKLYLAPSGPVSHPDFLTKEFLFLVIVYAAAAAFEYVFMPGLLYRRRQSGRAPGAASTTEITSEYIRDAMPNKPETRYAWSEVTGFAQNSQATLIYRPGRFTFFPTSAMTAEQRAELDAIVARYGVKRWSC